MAYDKNLYTSSTSVLSSGIIYDQTEAKLQSELNAGFKNTLNQLESDVAPIGTIVDSTKYTPAIPNGGVNTVVASMTVTKGVWLFLVSGWTPLNRSIVEQATSFSVKLSGSNSIGQFTMFRLMSGCCVSAISSNTQQIDLTVTNWENASVSEATTAYKFVAVRIK